MRQVVRDEMRTRHIRMLQRFVAEPEEVMEMMRATRSIISGPFALRYLEGYPKWAANDLDFYTPYESYEPTVNFFKDRGYREIVIPEPVPISASDPNRRGR